jgi:hypothetical protein
LFGFGVIYPPLNEKTTPNKSKQTAAATSFSRREASEQVVGVEWW